MQDTPPKQVKKFFKNIIIPKRQTTKIILPLQVKQIFPEQKTEQIIHGKSFMQQKLNPNAKFKVLFETMTKPVNRNPFAFSHIYRKDISQDKVFKSLNSDLNRMPKINELIFKSEMELLAKRMDQNSPSPQRRLNQTGLSFVYLRRSFKISQYCKSSLLSISHEARQRQYARYSSLSTIKEKKPEMKVAIKRHFAFRTSYRSKQKNDRFYTDKDQIRGWQTETKNCLLISQEDVIPY